MRKEIFYKKIFLHWKNSDTANSNNFNYNFKKNQNEGSTIVPVYEKNVIGQERWFKH